MGRGRGGAHSTLGTTMEPGREGGTGGGRAKGGEQGKAGTWERRFKLTNSNGSFPRLRKQAIGRRSCLGAARWMHMRPMPHAQPGNNPPFCGQQGLWECVYTEVRSTKCRYLEKNGACAGGSGPASPTPHSHHRQIPGRSTGALVTAKAAKWDRTGQSCTHYSHIAHMVCLDASTSTVCSVRSSVGSQRRAWARSNHSLHCTGQMGQRCLARSEMAGDGGTGGTEWDTRRRTTWGFAC